MNAIKNFFLILVSFFLSANFCFADIKLKVTVTNPSETEVKTFPVKTYLPKGIKPEDVSDKGDFEIDYDYDQSLYFANAQVTLNPRESRELQVKIKDIWVIPAEEITELRSQTGKLSEILAGSEYAGQIKIWTEKITSNLDTINNFQQLKDISVEDKISGFEKNKSLLKEVKKDLAVIENLALGSKEIPPESLGKLLGRDNPTIITKQEQQQAQSKNPRTIKLNIEVANPSSESKDIAIKFYLPEEIKDQDIINKSGLEVGYDYQKNIFYLYKDKAPFEAVEKKEFYPEIRDIWLIPDEKLEVLISHTKKLQAILKGSQFEKVGEFLGQKILDVLSQIKVKQDSSFISVEQHIGQYRENLSQLEDISKDMLKLESLIVEAGGTSRVLSQVAAKGKAPHASIGDGIEMQKQKLEMAGRVIFRGKAPDFVTVWRIIISILLFLGLITLFFIFLQLQQRRVISFDNLTGVFQRAYLIQRLKEELVVCQRTKGQCTVLVLDIDKFKKYNDTYGHLVGDIVIKEFVLALKESIRTNDLIGRYGGDEFVLVFPFVGIAAAKLIAEKLRKNVENWEIKTEQRTLKMSTSIGMAIYPNDGLSAESLIHKADQAMYQAKQKGGNSFYVFEK